MKHSVRASYFWPKVHIGQPNACWPWTAAKDKDGYGRFNAGDKMVAAHRFAYESTGRTIKHEIDHACRNRACCNPAHLRDVTHKENTQRSPRVQKKAPAKQVQKKAPTPVRHKAPTRIGACCRWPRGGNNAAARHARQTHCIHGHAFTPENTYRPPSGGRHCRQCAIDRNATKRKG